MSNRMPLKRLVKQNLFGLTEEYRYFIEVHLLLKGRPTLTEAIPEKADCFPQKHRFTFETTLICCEPNDLFVYY